MGLGLTFKKMLQHFVSEPDMIISSISLSIKDIVEILYFYFTINKSTTRGLKSVGSAFVIS